MDSTGTLSLPKMYPCREAVTSFCQRFLFLILVAYVGSGSHADAYAFQNSILHPNAHGSQVISRSDSSDKGGVGTDTDAPSSKLPRPRPPSAAVHHHHSGCPAVPKIDIISYTRTGFEATADQDTELTYLNPKIPNVIYAPFAAHIVLKCVSSSPIEWTFDGTFHPSISSIQVFHDQSPAAPNPNNTFHPPLSPSSSYSNTDNSCYRITVALKTTKSSTGKYWCRTVDKKHSRFWYLYGDGNTPPTLLYHGNEFDITPNGSTPVILPCQVVNPNLRPHLTKGAAGVIAIDNSVPYDPQVGFTLDLRTIPSPYDKYQCSVDNDPITFNIQRPADFSVTPASETLVIVKEQTMTLICEGKSPVGLQGFMDDTRITFPDYSEGSEFKYRVQYEYFGVESSQVSCIDLVSKNVHHTWNIHVIDKKTDNESGISYDPATKRFVCHSKTKHKPVMGLAQCSNPLECQLMDKCFSWNVPYKLTRIRPGTCSESKVSYGTGRPCTRSVNGNEEYVSDNVGCVAVKNSGPAGVVHCSVTDLNWTSTLYYFNGLKSGQDLVISNWREAPVEELAYIEIGKVPGINDNSVRTVTQTSSKLYVGESVQFTCSATKFLFSSGFKWMFKMDDGSYITPKEENTANDLGAYVYTQTSNLIIESHNIKSVVCFVHFWNESEWLNVSKELNILESVAPVILFPRGADGQPLLFSAGSNESIICKARGTPSPSVNWYRDGKRIESQTTILEDDNTIQGSRLYFGHVDTDDEGEYSCVALNVRGNVSTSVNVSVRNNRSPIYTGIGIAIIVVIFFIVIVGVLWWKLRKNKEIIRKLTQKEYEQFRKGDKKAMLNAPDDGYIRAQYMPYDSDYEIPEENLDIDKESILGAGEYGVVLKGTLRQNNTVEEVAVKTNKTNSDSNHLKALLCELKMLTYIGWHANVINLRGAVTTHIRERDVYLVVEYCKLGNLEEYLREKKPFYLHQIVNDKLDLNLTFNPSMAASNSYQPMQTEISTTDLISFSHQVAGAMEFLANKKVVHGDLAARNILLTGDRTVKITDFGLSKHLYNDCSNYVCHSSRPLPWKWLAPECLLHQKFSSQSDVWAFAITLWEIFSLGESPYPGVAFSFDFKHKLLGGFRMDKPEYANSCIWAVIQQCWATSPSQRPSFAALRKYFSWLLHHWDDPKGPPNLINDEVRYINPNELNHTLFED